MGCLCWSLTGLSDLGGILSGLLLQFTVITNEIQMFGKVCLEVNNFFSQLSVILSSCHGLHARRVDNGCQPSLLSVICELFFLCVASFVYLHNEFLWMKSSFVEMYQEY